MGFLSFLTKNKFSKFVNICYLLISTTMFFLTLISIFSLNLMDGKEYCYVIGGWQKAIGIELKYNLHHASAVLFLWLTMMIFTATIVNEKINYAIRGFVYIMLCGANGIILTNDVFNSYVFFEIICVTSYIIYSYGNRTTNFKSVYNYIILSSFVGVCILLIISLLYQITGNLNIDLMHKILHKTHNNKSVNICFILFVSVMILKLGTYPFHGILIEIYDNISVKYLIPVTGITSISYMYFVIKFITKLFGSDVLLINEYFNIILKILGSIGYIFFNLLALTANNVKSFIVLLSFSQTCLLTFCIPYLQSVQVVNGIIYSVMSNTAIKVCLFSILLKIQKSLSSKNEITKMNINNFLNIPYRYLLIFLLIFMAGLPFSLVFMSKWCLLSGIFNVYSNIYWFMIITIGLTIDTIACLFFIKNILSKNNNNISINIDYTLVFIILFALTILMIVPCFIGKFNIF